MSSCIGLQLPTATLHRLLNYLRPSGSDLDATAAADQAIREWLDRMYHEGGKPELAPTGYHWKSLFLPEGTRLNVFCKGDQGYAHVVGDQLFFQGEPISPNRFAELVSGYVRNAWEGIMIRFPGESRPKLASVLRREQQTPSANGLPQTVFGWDRTARNLQARVVHALLVPGMKLPCNNGVLIFKVNQI